ncbi:CobW family GTP-binding protein [Desulfovibrio legallii]|jgi:G3E family GTPase|uniref:GTPase, G3E family n=1 Tax=Desulfovibrio legallii TaxID=571438 RepID=A0A1G7JSH5_9BACT|nr:GTP-binding protein [Desulfovibrio legallii]SDF27888.1 GTPase, G3E family [Desulfovibrio legallii]
MRLAALLPRQLAPENGPESPTIMNCLLAGVHLERRRARALGWRGVRASGGGPPAWTCRVAGAPHVYGLAFCEERCEDGALHGRFTCYVFPKAADPVLDIFPLQALAVALGPDYGAAVRDLSLYVPALKAFRLGHVGLTAALDGSSLILTLAAPARQRSISTSGVAAPAGIAGEEAAWIVPPGGLECDVPAFRLLLRPFAALAGTAAALLGEEARLRLLVARQDPFAQGDAPGDAASASEGAWLMLRAALGQDRAHPPQASACGAADGASAAVLARSKALCRLPGRYRPRGDAGSALPVMHVLTGFLGAGKTTFLRRWLDYLNGREQFAAVIQNELGSIGLDAALTRGETHVEALDAGCVCCTLADSLRPGLQRLLDAAPAEQVILETTGVANPANVLAALAELDDLVRPGLVVTVADALAWDENGDGVRLAQVTQADVIIANKADAVSPERLEAVLADLRRRNPQAVILPAVEGNIAFAVLDSLYAGWLDERGRPPSRTPRLEPICAARATTHGDEGITAFSRPMTGPVSEDALRRLLAEAGPGLQRAKGIVDLRVAGGARPAVVQYAAGRLEFEIAPDDAPERYLVFIGVDLNPALRGGGVLSAGAGAARR